MNWKFWVRMALPFLRNAGEDFKAKDENSTGRDDLIGTSLVYAADLLDAILADKTTLPKAPSVLK